jgi:hypothetical protein
MRPRQANHAFIEIDVSNHTCMVTSASLAAVVDSVERLEFEITLGKNWLAQKRELVTTDILPNAQMPDLPYVNPGWFPNTY